jgi:hypothetical protein
MFGEYPITIKRMSERVAFSLTGVDLQESYCFECSSYFLVSTVMVPSCCHLKTDMCLYETNKEGHVAFDVLVE